jgi:hypothetical protein
MKERTSLHSTADSVERYLEDQAFAPSYDLAPAPLPPLRIQVHCLSQSSYLRPVKPIRDKGISYTVLREDVAFRTRKYMVGSGPGLKDYSLVHVLHVALLFW